MVRLVPGWIKAFGWMILWRVFFGIPEVFADWTLVTQSLPEANIQYVKVDPLDTKRLFAASDRRLYRSTDQGQAWKRIMSLRSSSDKIKGITFDPHDASRIYVATLKGIRYSKDRGTKWEILYQGIGETSKVVNDIALFQQRAESLLVATGDGLVWVDKTTGQATVVAGLPRMEIYSVWADKNSSIFVTTSKGIWKSEDGGVGWIHVYTQSQKEFAGDSSLEQFQIEELSLVPNFSNMVSLPNGRLFAASKNGVLEGATQNNDWKLQPDSSTRSSAHYLAASQNVLYAATDQGVFAKDSSQRDFRDISEGLASLKIHMLYYNEKDNSLYAATERGAFRYSYPELKIQSAPSQAIPSPSPVTPSLDRGVETAVAAPDPQAILKQFDHEPTVRAIQQAAIRYAEVHPEKIEAWRKSAAKKALLPTVSVRTDGSRDQNVDLDRGGTNDPDQFITGPAEKSMDWSVGASWDLGDLIWNADQTSIDTRSKLMVELRDDVLTEVTHLYYERRRLQVDLALAPPKDIALSIEKNLKLQELTANIDGLTGGYLSRQLEGR